MPLGGATWNTFPPAGSMTAREFFAGCTPLLQGVIDASLEFDRGVLDDQIRATLSPGTRESSLPLTEGSRANGELVAQARVVGDLIAGWAAEALDELLDKPMALPGGPLAIRSNCDGHLLTHEAADMLLGRRGGPVGMQLYNEWLHQMVLLRDALLPFTNAAEVPLHVTPAGLRHIEPARERFLAEALFRQIRHGSVVAFAHQAITGAPADTETPAGLDAEPAGHSRTAAYGFDHDGGTVLPAVVGASPVTAPAYLLTWHPASPGAVPTAYVTETADYFAAPRTLVEELPAPAGKMPPPGAARVVPGPARGGVRTARIEIGMEGRGTVSVDLGQALRGHRYAYHQPTEVSLRPATDGPEADRGRPADGEWPSRSKVSAGAALAADGLLWTREGDVAVEAGAVDGLVLLALLGKIYPENVVLRRGAGSAAPVTVGKQGPSRFVIDLAG
ncbi:hypothetical protein AB0J83_37920 [Actinoplanes sp. NPDC049596]|uniref:hypothetical protein n=1 Tax=unclassified Actinoplanes TaxID=2626549 RepID=UPI00342B45AA